MSREMEVLSTGPEATRALGKRLGELLEPGDVILLSGELGAGKTTFVQGLAGGLGFDGAVSSKSFVLLGEYPGRLTLYHADLYRLQSPDEAFELGLEEISPYGVLVVEWPERAEDVLPRENLRVQFAVEDEEHRRLTFTAQGERACSILDRFAEAVPR